MKVQVAYLTLQSSTALLMFRTDSIFSIQRINPTAPSFPLKFLGLQAMKALYEQPLDASPDSPIFILGPTVPLPPAPVSPIPPVGMMFRLSSYWAIAVQHVEIPSPQ